MTAAPSGPSENVLDTLFGTLDALEFSGIEAMVMGGLVVPLYTWPVPTQDVDLTISAKSGEIATLLVALSDRGVSIPDPALAGHRNHLSAGFEVIKATRYYPGNEVRIDLFPISTRYQEVAFTRRREGTIAGRTMWVIAPEDLLLHKSIANRKKDQYALERMVLVQGLSGQLDLAYLARWADELGLRAVIAEHFVRWGIALPD